jgi:drug/metabolite transporter (DMT)-like permease
MNIKGLSTNSNSTGCLSINRKQHQMKNQTKAYLFGLITVLFWSTVASAFKLSLRYMDHIQLLLYSCLVSLIVLGLIILIKGDFRVLFSYSRKQYIRSCVLGFLNPFLYYLILFKAYDLLPAQEVQPLNYTWALTLTFLSIPLLKQKIAFKEILSGFVAYFGVLVIATHGSISNMTFTDPFGVFLALSSTVIWALYWIYNKKSELDPIHNLFLNFLFGFPFIFFFCLMFSDIRIEFDYGLLGAVYVGIFEMGITFVCWLFALKFSTNSAKVANLIFISPFLSLIFIYFLVGEQILVSTFIGLVFIITGLLIQTIKMKDIFK